MRAQENNKYRITFFSPGGMEQHTVMKGSSLPAMIATVASIMADPHGYFVNDSKNNCYFRVIQENVSYIQYELLFSNKELTVENIKNVAPTIIESLVAEVRDAELYAMAFYDFDLETKKFLLSHMDVALCAEISKEEEKLLQVSSVDTYQAQEILIDKLIAMMKGLFFSKK